MLTDRMFISSMQLWHYSAGGAVGSSALTFKVVYCNSLTVNPVLCQGPRKGNLPFIRLAPSYSGLIAFFISAHTSAGPYGTFVTEEDPEIIAYAYPFTPSLLGDTTDIDPDCSLN